MVIIRRPLQSNGPFKIVVIYKSGQMAKTYNRKHFL